MRSIFVAALISILSGCGGGSPSLPKEDTMPPGTESTPTPSPIPSPSPEPSVTPSATPEPSPSPSVVPSPEPSPVPSVTPSPSPTASPTPVPSPSPSATPSPTPTPTNVAPVWDTQPSKYQELVKELQLDIGLGYDPDGGAITYVFEMQYYCSAGKVWNQQWAASLYGNIIRIMVPNGREDFNPHFYLFSAKDDAGAKVYRMIEVAWGGGSTFAPLYSTDYTAVPDTSALCGGATVYHN